MGLFKPRVGSSLQTLTNEPKSESTTTEAATMTADPSGKRLPRYNHNGHLVTRGIHPDGESGRKGKIALSWCPYDEANGGDS